MKARCEIASASKYERYGGRGINVCDRWQAFEAFAADMGQPPTPAHSIERNDLDGNYELDNCRWATKKEQARNTRATRWVEFRGEVKSMAEWAEVTGLNYGTLQDRLKNGWTPEEALSAPTGSRRRRAQC